MRRRDLLALAAGLTSIPLRAVAQQNAMPVIGFLHSGAAESNPLVTAAFRQGLTEARYVEGQNAAIEYRWAQGRYERLPALAADLVGRKVSVIATGGGTPAAIAAKKATSTIPIVFAGVGDPVASGLVASLARPGGNLTGISIITLELMPKRLELLTELVPTAGVVALLANPNTPGQLQDRLIRSMRAAADSRHVQLQVVNAGSQSEIEAAFVALSRSHPDALVVGADPFFSSQREQLVALAARHRLPTIYEWREFSAAGGLISYGTSIAGTYRQAGSYVGRVLAGASPADLPVQQPTTFELVINLKTAKALALTVPPSLLARADEVIE